MEALSALVEETNAGALYFTRHYEPHWQSVENELYDTLGDRVDIRRFPGTLLWQPDAIKTEKGDPFRVFTPFWRRCLREPSPTVPLPQPTQIQFTNAASESLDHWNLLPQRPDWAAGLRATWEPGETHGHLALEDFASQRVEQYTDHRDRPDKDGTSKLSPHLHFGELSPRQVWHAVQSRGASDASSGAAAYIRQLGWREFCYHLLHHWPDIAQNPFRSEYRDFPWQDNPSALAAWQRGHTGIPIVDAGMRQLWDTGWMHNRVRMIVASLLTKNLLVPWQHGAEWFWDTLVDADLANNSAGWQWVAGCGADAAPYFRIFNPVTQGERFDPDGKYVRRFVPELGRLPDRYIHAPWKAPESALSDIGFQLGRDYPTPMVDLKESRQLALAAFSTHKEQRSKVG